MNRVLSLLFFDPENLRMTFSKTNLKRQTWTFQSLGIIVWVAIAYQRKNKKLALSNLILCIK